MRKFALLGFHMIISEIVLQDDETALHEAALEGRAEVAKVLVKYGAAVDIRNKVFIAESGSTYLTM